MADNVFDRGRLATALAANTAGSAVEHVLVALPSFSVGESLLSHYADRIAMLEHRYLLSVLMLGRIPSCHLVFICSQRPEDSAVDHYLSLLPGEADSLRSRLHVLVVPDRSGRPVAAKMLERPDLVDRLCEVIGGRPGLVEPWNVTTSEVELAQRIGLPLNGSPPELLPVAYKSAGRRLLAQAGVPVPTGVEDVRSGNDVIAATDLIRRSHPKASGVVVKTDDSGAGDGNKIIRFDGTSVRDAVAALPDWYLDDLAAGGGIVEELLSGTRVSSPSAQADIEPDGTVRVLATHEQILGGADGQVYLGYRFPADPSYAATLARHVEAVGQLLAVQGAIGRFSVDFIAVADAHTGPWELSGLEINLRKGGTTHPYCALRNLVPGRYDPGSGQWIADDGTVRHYEATDNLVHPGCVGMPVEELIDVLDHHKLTFDRRSGTGAVVHMVNGLAVDGRLGITAIGTTSEEARHYYAATERALDHATQ